MILKKKTNPIEEVNKYWNKTKKAKQLLLPPSPTVKEIEEMIKKLSFTDQIVLEKWRKIPKNTMIK